MYVCTYAFVYLFIVVLGMESRAQFMLGKHTTTELHPYARNTNVKGSSGEVLEMSAMLLNVQKL
jgi:hypothetical protein